MHFPSREGGGIHLKCKVFWQKNRRLKTHFNLQNIKRIVEIEVPKLSLLLLFGLVFVRHPTQFRIELLKFILFQQLGAKFHKGEGGAKP